MLTIRSAPRDGNRPSAKMLGANMVCDPSIRMPHTSDTTIRMVSIGTTVIYAFIVLWPARNITIAATNSIRANHCRTE